MFWLHWLNFFNSLYLFEISLLLVWINTHNIDQYFLPKLKLTIILAFKLGYLIWILCLCCYNSFTFVFISVSIVQMKPGKIDIVSFGERVFVYFVVKQFLAQLLLSETCSQQHGNIPNLEHFKFMIKFTATRLEFVYRVLFLWCIFSIFFESDVVPFVFWVNLQSVFFPRLFLYVLF